MADWEDFKTFIVDNFLYIVFSIVLLALVLLMIIILCRKKKERTHEDSYVVVYDKKKDSVLKSKGNILSASAEAEIKKSEIVMGNPSIGPEYTGVVKSQGSSLLHLSSNLKPTIIPIEPTYRQPNISADPRTLVTVNENTINDPMVTVRQEDPDEPSAKNTQSKSREEEESLKSVNQIDNEHILLNQ